MIGGTQSLNQADGVFSGNGTGGNWGAGHDNYAGNPRVKFSHLHSHTISITDTGNNQYHENRMPYESVRRWKRTA